MKSYPHCEGSVSPCMMNNHLANCFYKVVIQRPSYDIPSLNNVQQSWQCNRLGLKLLKVWACLNPFLFSVILTMPNCMLLFLIFRKSSSCFLHFQPPVKGFTVNDLVPCKSENACNICWISIIQYQLAEHSYRKCMHWYEEAAEGKTILTVNLIWLFSLYKQ